MTAMTFIMVLSVSAGLVMATVHLFAIVLDRLKVAGATATTNPLPPPYRESVAPVRNLVVVEEELRVTKAKLDLVLDMLRYPEKYGREAEMNGIRTDILKRLDLPSHESEYRTAQSMERYGTRFANADWDLVRDGDLVYGRRRPKVKA